MSQRTSRQPTHPHKCRLCAKPHTLSASPPRSGPCRRPRKTHSIFFSRNFCAARRIRPLPVDPDHFLSWLELLITKLAGRTVTVAISAIVAWCALNNLPHPIEANPVLRRAWKGLVRTRSVRVTPQKLPLTELLDVSVSTIKYRAVSALAMLGVERACYAWR